MNEASASSTCTPTGSATQSKKRELSSPEFFSDIKKNKVLSDSLTESESDISITETMASNMDSNETIGVGADTGLAGDVSAQFTLQETHMQKIASLMKDSFEPQVKQIIQESFQQQVADLVKSIVQGVLTGLHGKITSLENENLELKKRVKALEDAADNAEQYSRRNCLRITGVAEADNESTDDFVINLARNIDVDLNPQDIDRSHRLGKLNSNRNGTTKPRDIIVKFATYRMRATFYKARVLTKDRGFRGVYVNENLTKPRSKLLYEARRRMKSKQVKGAWSFDGCIFVKHFDDSIRKITSDDDLPQLTPLDPQQDG